MNLSDTINLFSMVLELDALPFEFQISNYTRCSNAYTKFEIKMKLHANVKIKQNLGSQKWNTKNQTRKKKE